MTNETKVCEKRQERQRKEEEGQRKEEKDRIEG